MKFLVDTNLLIRAEPTSPASLEPGAGLATEVLGLIAHQGNQAYVHPASVEELRRDRDAKRRVIREILVQKYPRIPSPPAIPNELEDVLGSVERDSHDYVDYLLLACVSRDAVDFLVTDDQKLSRKAVRVGLGDRVLTPADAVMLLRGLDRTTFRPPPSVRECVAHELDEKDPIFDSLREDYAEFDSWLRVCKLQHRRCWVIESGSGTLAGVVIVKDEFDKPYGLQGPILKICTFKISDHARGVRYGELLLKAVFEFAFGNDYAYTYVEVLPKHEGLIGLLEMFGFSNDGTSTSRGDLVFMKRLSYTTEDWESLSELEFHVQFGPRYFKLRDAFLVPILPEYHRLLFPEYDPQPTLFWREGHPVGNSIRKAYVCNSPTRQVVPGSVLLFYESGGSQTIRCLGVVDDVLVSKEPAEIVRFVGQRTVYNEQEIKRMCSSHVLTLLFRQAFGALNDPIFLEELTVHGALRRAPQSITRIKGESFEWLRERLAQWH